MKKLVAILLLAPTLAFSAPAEVELACDLEKTKASITASILSAPYLYGSGIIAPDEKSVSGGIGYSFGGRARGSLIREMADAKCESIAGMAILDEQQKWVLVNIAKEGAKAEYVATTEARVRTAEYLASVEQQLRANTVTIAEYNTAKQTKMTLDNRIGQLRTVLAEPSQPLNFISIKSILERTKFAEGRVAELAAKIELNSAWDVTTSLGVKKEIDKTGINSGTPTKAGAVAGVTFRWSFGGQKEAASKIREQTEQLFDINQNSYKQAMDRLTAKLSELSIIEKDRLNQLDISIRESDNLIASFKNINTLAAQNTKRTLELQNFSYRAEVAGIAKRVEKYNEILGLLQKGQ